MCDRWVGGVVSDRTVVDRPLIDASLRVAAVVAQQIALRIALVCNAVLRLRRSAADNEANDRQFQSHVSPGPSFVLTSILAALRSRIASGRIPAPHCAVSQKERRCVRDPGPSR